MAVRCQKRRDAYVDKEKEAFHVMKEDLSKWLNEVLETTTDSGATTIISPDNFLNQLDTGVILCCLARKIQEAAKNKLPLPVRTEGKNEQHQTMGSVKIPMGEIRFNKEAKRGSFQARDNTANFIKWCRCLRIEESLIFESEGLVLHRDERRVILTLLSVARVGVSLGLCSPRLIELEREIENMEDEMAGEENEKGKREVMKPPNAKRRKKENLDLKVLSILHQCTCARRLQAISYGCGKFHITMPSGRSMTIYVRVLQERVMVRVGGGWDTLEHLLLKHDPCRSISGISASLSLITSVESTVKSPTRASPSRVRQVLSSSINSTLNTASRKRKATIN